MGLYLRNIGMQHHEGSPEVKLSGSRMNMVGHEKFPEEPKE
jgi:hypothetical protein